MWTVRGRSVHVSEVIEGLSFALRRGLRVALQFRRYRAMAFEQGLSCVWESWVNRRTVQWSLMPTAWALLRWNSPRAMDVVDEILGRPLGGRGCVWRLDSRTCLAFPSCGALRAIESCAEEGEGKKKPCISRKNESAVFSVVVRRSQWEWGGDPLRLDRPGRSRAIQSPWVPPGSTGVRMPMKIRRSVTPTGSTGC